jgi:hypothetical protein
MSALIKAVDHVKFSIPFEVLRVAFKDDLHNWRQAPISIDTQIMDKVIKPRVLIDANLVGGAHTIVSLEGLSPKFLDNYTMMYEIPPDRVSYREIVSVLSIGYLPYAGALGYGSGQGVPTNGSMTDLNAVGQRVMDSVSSIPSVSTATCDLVGYNTVVVRDNQRLAANYSLRCIIANDSNLANINPRSYIPFAKLCELAVKAFIYNTLIIKIDQAYLSGGQDLGAMRNYIEGLSDAEQMYQTQLSDVWRNVAFHNDQPSHERFIRSMISPGI